MAGNWWDQENAGGNSPMDIALGLAGPWGLSGRAAYEQSGGNVGEAAAATAFAPVYWGLDYATGSFGRDQQQAITEAEAADVAAAEATKKRNVLNEAKAARRDAPYAAAGLAGLQGQRDLLGLNGPEAQAAAEAQLMASPQFAAMVDTSEQAILANASATGGLV